MASSPYKPVMFVDGEPLDRDKLNQMANNDQWLYENTPRIAYSAFGLVKYQGTKILAGSVAAPATLNTVTWGTVYLGTYFSQGCRPIVVATPTTGSARTKYEVVVRGIGTMFPDNRGFQIGVTTDEAYAPANHHSTSLPINWIAIGW